MYNQYINDKTIRKKNGMQITVGIFAVAPACTVTDIFRPILQTRGWQKQE